MRRDFFNRSAAVWDEKVAEKDRTKLSSIVRRLSITPGSALLDIGVGTGILTSFLLQQVGTQGKIIAIDFAVEMLRCACQKGFMGNIHFLCADATSLPLRRETCDLVICYSSFPHFPDKPAALRESCRVLKPGGRLVICHTSSRKEINAIHRDIPDVAADMLPDEIEMRQLLIFSGFRNIRVEDGASDYLCSGDK
jgi:ubiquinone/menaquinone biosynthesis C-methylase UbiE